jgi:hypothetical protein
MVSYSDTFNLNMTRHGNTKYSKDPSEVLKHSIVNVCDIVYYLITY